MGPKYLIIKKGEHGAVLMSRDSYFVAPAFPLEKVVDPTGAGDSFAGGFVGFLQKSGNIDDDAMRRAVIYGSAVASFSVEDFSFNRLKNLTSGELESRVDHFSEMTRF
jgi:sugar/nucleoside kinase (ribokinase family)